MRRTILAASLLLAMTATGCSDSDDDEASPDTAAVASATPSTSGSYVSQVNALCEAMIPGVMAVRGDEDGDGGGDIPSIDEWEEQQLRIAPITAEFDAKVDAIPVAESDRAAADAFDAYRKFIDADTERVLAAVKAGDEETYNASMVPSAEFDAQFNALRATGIECPAR